jgi:Zn-dependent protease
MDELIRNLAVYALPVLFAITMHNAAQAYAAKYFGDMTPFAAGRVTANPLAHIDPFGTIILPIIMYLATHFVFGYAKPLPIDYSRLRNPTMYPIVSSSGMRPTGLPCTLAIYHGALKNWVRLQSEHARMPVFSWPTGMR